MSLVGIVSVVAATEQVLGIVAGITKLGAQVGEQVAKNTKLK